MACQLNTWDTNRPFSFIPRVGPLQGSLYQRQPFWLPDFLREYEVLATNEEDVFHSNSSSNSFVPLPSPPDWLKQDPAEISSHSSPSLYQDTFMTPSLAEVKFPPQTRSNKPMWELLNQDQSTSTLNTSFSSTSSPIGSASSSATFYSPSPEWPSSVHPSQQSCAPSSFLSGDVSSSSSRGSSQSSSHQDFLFNSSSNGTNRNNSHSCSNGSSTSMNGSSSKTHRGSSSLDNFKFREGSSSRQDIPDASSQRSSYNNTTLTKESLDRSKAKYNSSNDSSTLPTTNPTNSSSQHPSTYLNPNEMSQPRSSQFEQRDKWAQFLVDQRPRQQSINVQLDASQSISELKPPSQITLTDIIEANHITPLETQPLKLQPLRLQPLQMGKQEQYHGDPLLQPHFDNEVSGAPAPAPKKARKNAKSGTQLATEPKKKKPTLKSKVKSAKPASASTLTQPTQEPVIDLDLTLEPSQPGPSAVNGMFLSSSVLSPTHAKRYKQMTLGMGGSAVTPEKTSASPGSAKKKKITKSPKAIKQNNNSTTTTTTTTTTKSVTKAAGGSTRQRKKPAVEGALGAEPTAEGEKPKRKRKSVAKKKAGDNKSTDTIDDLLDENSTHDAETPKNAAGALRYDVFTSQHAFSKHCLDFLEQHCKDIHSHLEEFQQVAHTAERVVIALFWDDGSTSYRFTTAEQRKAVRAFRKNEPVRPVIDAFPTDRSERDPLALVFRFTSHQFMLNLSTGMDPMEQAVVLDLFRNERMDKIAFDAKNTLWALLCHCKMLPCYPIPCLMDPQLGGWLCDPDNQAHTGFEFPGLVEQYSSPRFVKSQVAQFALPQLLEDINNTGVLAELLKQRLDQEGLWDSFAEQEMQMVPLMATLQFNGIAFDRKLFTSRRHFIAVQLANLEQQACTTVGKQFLLTSPEQVARVLFEDLKLPQLNSANRGRSSATNSRHHATGNEILAKLSALHPLPGIILQHRTLSKKLSTYMDPMIRASCPNRQGSDGGYRIYSQWNQILTGTGRLSSSKPNLQSLPRSRPTAAPKLSFSDLLEPSAEEDAKFDDMVNIREAFVVSDPNKVLLSADFSQMEMRILALLSKDPSLQTFFNKAQGDIYNLLASACFKLAPEQVKPSDRDKAKAVSLGIIYGMGPQSTAESLTRHNPDHPISVDEAKLLIATWHKTFPLVRVFINKTVELARQKGYVCTLSNRRRYLPNLKSAQAIQRSYAERQSVNTVIQGSAADIMKRGMCRLFAALRELPDIADLVLQLHDEVVLEVNASALDQVKVLVRQCLEEVVSASSIRFPVNIKSGKSLGTLHSLP